MTGALADFTIRKAEPSDAHGIAHVYVETWRSAYPASLPASVLLGLSAARQESYWHGLLRAGEDAIHVAETGGWVVGFAAAGRARAWLPGHKGEVYTLYVMDDWQGRGMGRALVAAAFDSLAARGLAPAVIWVLADNPARFFYERLGGKRAGERVAALGGQDHREIAYSWPVPRIAARPGER